AFHSCGVGAPTVFIVRFPSGTFYHPGDTGLFASMKLFGQLYKPDLFFAPIGSYYVCDVHQAAMATEIIKPRVVIPMHYDTFPVIQADPAEFKRLVNKQVPEVKVEIIKPGEIVEV
ncbi:MAG: MBL fold metallo-hydrolase, partial [Candidatus Thorarchaeota archaeon]